MEGGVEPFEEEKFPIGFLVGGADGSLVDGAVDSFGGGGGGVLEGRGGVTCFFFFFFCSCRL